jgi:flagellin-like hook-associated protein FlgL
MSLVVGTNVSALYSQNALKTNARSTATTMERLSTGVRVNSARDDAAGLAIGQNMTSQIRGLNQAVRNINDGINLVQTAEGGLNSVSNMLQRMRELAVQAANGTYSDVQRGYLNQEVLQLQTAIGQVVDTTMWNDQKVLDGSFSKPIQIGSDVNTKMDVSIPGLKFDSVAGVASDGSIYIAGYSAGDYDGLVNAGSNDGYLTKYSADGAKQWSKLIGTTTSDEIGGVTVSADGMITVTGRTTGNLDGNTKSGLSDIFLAEFTQEGEKVYSKLIGGTGIDVGSAITADANGSIILAGQTNAAFDGQPLSAAEDGVVIKLNEDGTRQWTRILGSTSSGASYSVSIGQDGAYYVAGRANNQGSLTKYSPDGTKVWEQPINADHVLNNAGNAVYGVTTSIDGSIYITGPKLGDMDGQTSHGGNDAFVVKYSSDGTKQWTKLLGTAGTDAGYGIKAGSDGSVYVAGETGAQAGADSAFLKKLDSNGNELWTQIVQGTAGTSTGARGVTITDDGSAYLTGYTNTNLDGQSAVGGRDIYLTKFSPSGEKLWTRISGSTADDNPYQAIASSNLSVDISNKENATRSLKILDHTLDSINSTRATLGSYINRLAYAADNVTNISSNATQSRSTIIDADYAIETTNLAKNQIIQQAATAMLAQANTQPQAVMALLKNA